MSDSEEMEEMDVPPGFVPPPPAEPPAKTNCVKCTKEWDLKDEAHRAKVVYVDCDAQPGQPKLHCCACVPASAASTVIECLAADRYKWEALANALLAEKQKLLHVQEEKQADLQIAQAKLRKAFKQYTQLSTQLRHVTQGLRRARDNLDAGIKKAMRTKNQKKKQERLLSTCCEAYSGARHCLRRQALNGLSGVFKPAALTEIDSVHPISLEVDKNGRESVAFCTVCAGFHGVGSDELEEHPPQLAIIKLTGSMMYLNEDDAKALKALAVPFDAQPVAMQTNGLAESN